MNSQTKPTYQQLVDTVKAYDKFIIFMKNRLTLSREQSEILLELLKPLWVVDNIVAQCNEMDTSDEPTYEELVQSLLALDDGWSDLFSQCCSNPVKNAWGEDVNFTALNKGREVASSTIYKLRSSISNTEADVKQPETKMDKPSTSGIQKYLENFDEYAFTSLLLRDMVEQEQRRQSKNCPEVQPAHEIEEAIKMESNDSSIQLALMIVKALSYAAKGEV